MCRSSKIQRAEYGTAEFAEPEISSARFLLTSKLLVRNKSIASTSCSIGFMRCECLIVFECCMSLEPRQATSSGRGKNTVLSHCIYLSSASSSSLKMPRMQINQLNHLRHI